MTTNGAKIVGGIIGGALGSCATLMASWIAKRSTPNYEAQIRLLTDELRHQSESLRSILERQSENTSSIQEHLSNSMKVAWRPTARIDNSVPNSMELVMKGNREFSIDSVSLFGPNKAVVASIAVDEGIKSTGFRVPLPQSENVKAWNTFAGLTQSVSAYVRYSYEVDGAKNEDELPVLMTQGVSRADSVTTMYIKIDG